MKGVFQTDVLLVGLHEKHFNRRTCNQHLLLHMFYCTHDYYSRFYIPLTFIYQLKSDRCPSEQRAQACTAKQNLKSLSSDFIALSSLLHSIFTHTLSTNSYSLLSEIQIFLHTFSQTLFSTHNLCYNGNYYIHPCRCGLCPQ